MRAQNTKGVKIPGMEAFGSAMFPFSGPMAESVMKSSRMYLDACIEFQEEVVDFTSKRLHADFELQRSACQCKNANELAKLHQDWAARTLNDYAAEAEKLTGLLGHVAQNGMQSLKEPVKEAVSSVAAKVEERAGR